MYFASFYFRDYHTLRSYPYATPDLSRHRNMGCMLPMAASHMQSRNVAHEGNNPSMHNAASGHVRSLVGSRPLPRLHRSVSLHQTAVIPPPVWCATPTVHPHICSQLTFWSRGGWTGR